MFSVAYRDIQSIPYIASLKRNKAELYGRLIYIFGALVFSASVISYSMIDALKDKQVYISTTNTNGNCEMLSALIKKINVDTEIGNWGAANTNKYFTFGYVSGFEITYDNTFFSTYEQCLDSVSTSCKVDYYISGAFRFDIECSFTDSISLNKQTVGYCSPPLCTCNDRANTLTCILTDEIITEEMQGQILPPSKVCEPFRQNHPPYQCTSYATKNYLEIISQSFAISSASISFLFAFSLFLITTFFIQNVVTESEKHSEFELPEKFEKEVSKVENFEDSNQISPDNEINYKI